MVSATYRRRTPEDTLLHQVVRENLATFLDWTDARASDGRGLPRYVKNAFARGPIFLEDLPGLSVFAKAGDGRIFHTYSTYARGLDPIIGTYQILDLVPKGRGEDGLVHSMAWVRHHDKYGENYVVDPRTTCVQPRDVDSCCHP